MDGFSKLCLAKTIAMASSISSTVLCALALVCCTLFVSVKAFTLSQPRLLLPKPRGDHKVTHVLESDGCLFWQSRRNDVVTVQPINPKETGCATSALLEVRWTGPLRASAEIVATERDTGTVLRCDVSVDNIQKIELVTVDRTMYLNDAPVTLQVAGYDSNDNMFSTLSALTVSWQFLNESCTGTLHQPNLEMLQFANSDYDSPLEIQKLEEQNLRGSLLLTNSIDTGRVCVRAELKNAASLLLSATAVITVVERLHLVPSTAYVVPEQAVTFKVETTNGLTSIADTPYTLGVADSKVGKLQDTDVVVGVKPGDTTVSLGDNAGLLDQQNAPTSYYVVVDPYRLSIDVETCSHQASSKCVLKRGGKYQVQLKLVDSTGNNILLDNLEFKLELPNADEIFKAANSTWATYVPKEVKSSVEFKGEYMGPTNATSETALLTAHRPIQVVDPLSISPPEIFVPWFPGAVAPATFEATGGTGSYRWSTPSQDRLLLDPADKTCQVQPQAIGDWDVVVSDTYQTALSAKAVVHAHTAVKMAFKPGYRATGLNKVLALPLALFDANGREFDITSHVEPSYSASCNAFDVVGSCESNLPCVNVKAIQDGDCEVVAVWRNLTATTTVSTHASLAIVPKDKSMLVTPGASYTLHYTGGPPPSSDRSLYFRKLVTEKRESVSVRRNTVDSSSFIIECKYVGCQTVTVQVGNRAAPGDNDLPLVEEDTAEFCCSIPSKLDLALDFPPEQLDTSSECPDLEANMFKVRNSRSMNVVATAVNKDSRRFDNQSTLVLSWSSTEPSLSKFESQLSATTAQFQLSKQEGVSKVTATGRIGESTISGFLGLHLHNSPVLSPSSLVLLDNPRLEASGTVEFGTGTFNITDPAGFVSVNVQQRNVAVRGQRAGSSSLELEDLCLIPLGEKAKADVSVRKLDSVEVFVKDKVQLHKTLKAEVCLFGEGKEPIPLELYPHITLSPSLSDSKLEPVFLYMADKGDTSMEYKCNGAIFQLTGKQPGMSSITFTATSNSASGSAIASRPRAIQVFSPLSVEPKRLLLLPGACHHVSVVGGPTGDVSTLFQTKMTDIATVDETGLVCGVLPGTTDMSVNVMSTVERSFVLASETVIVQVVLMTSMELKLPSPRLLSGSVVEVHVQPMYNGEPVYGAYILNVAWSTSNSNIAIERSIFHASNVTLAIQPQFHAELNSLYEGYARIEAQTPCDPVYCHPSVRRNSDKLVASTQLQVVPKLRVTNGQDLLLPVGGQHQIETSCDTLPGLRFSVLGSPSTTQRAGLVVDSRGRILTGASAETVVVLVAIVRDDEVVQSQAVHVRVAHVQHLSLRPLVSASSADCNHLPAGESCKVSVVLHDTYGREFSSASGLNLMPQLDVSGIARVESVGDTLLQITGVSWGQALLTVSISGSQNAIANYMVVSVGFGLTPGSARCPVGSTVCFKSSSPLASQSWSVSNGAVATVSNGRIYLKAAGETLVNLHTDERTTSGQLFSSVLSTVAFANAPAAVSNAPGSVTSITVIPQDAQGNLFDAMGACGEATDKQRFFDVSCEVDTQHSAFFEADARFNSETGAYICDLIGLPVPEPKAVNTNALTSNVVVKAVVTLGQARATNSVALPFKPALSATQSCTLNDASSKGDVNSCQVQVFGVDNPSHLDVTVQGAKLSGVRLSGDRMEWSAKSLMLVAVPSSAGPVIDVVLSTPDQRSLSSETVITFTDKASGDSVGVSVFRELAETAPQIIVNTSSGGSWFTALLLLVVVVGAAVILLLCSALKSDNTPKQSVIDAPRRTYVRAATAAPMPRPATSTGGLTPRPASAGMRTRNIRTAIPGAR
eukprot:m.104175 g.104175  ORF g.104175 m.104175 type:complete len:1823 (-) comp13256_c0_seq1:1404-6872(-)